MKTINTFLKITAFALLTAGLLAGCLFEPPLKNTKTGMGAVEITIAGSQARTLLPDWDGVSYSVSYATAGGAPTEADSLSIELSAGTYTFTVTAKKDGSVIGIGTAADILVAANTSTPVEVYLTPEDGEDGTLSWTLIYPNVAGVSATLEYYDDDEDDWMELTPANSGTKDFAPGSYMVRSSLEGQSGKTAGDIEAFHIYPALSTVLHWNYPSNMLVADKDLTGSVTFTLTGAEVTGVSMTLSGDGGMEDIENIELTEAAGVWSFETKVPDNVTELGGTLYITTANNDALTNAQPLEYGFSNIAYSAGITIPAIEIFTLSVTITGDGALLVYGYELADGEELDLIGGTEVSVEAIADTGNKFMSMEVDGTDVGAAHDTITIDADTAISVTFEAGADPNVLFEWSQSVDPWPGLAQPTLATPAGTAVAPAYPAINAVVSLGNRPTDANTDGPQVPAVDNSGTSYGGARLVNNNLAFGLAQRPAANTAGADTWKTAAYNLGQFDLSSRKFRLTISYKDGVNGAASGLWMRVFLNNNTTGQANSLFGAQSRILNLDNDTLFPTTSTNHTDESSSPVNTSTFHFLQGSDLSSGTVFVEVDPVAVYGPHAGYQTLTKAFISIVVPNTSAVTLTGVKVEYIEDTVPALSAVKIYNNDTAALVSDTAIEMIEGDGLNLIAQFVPASVTPAPTVAWASSDSSDAVITITDGVVATVAAGGPVTITAEAASLSSTVEITVVEPLALSITDNLAEIGSSIDLDLGDTKTLTADVSGEQGVNIVWEIVSGTSASLDTTSGDIVVITASDTVAGNTVIKVTASKDGFATATKTFTVSVTDPGAAVDNVIWEWKHSVDPWPSAGLASGGQDTNKFYATGYGTDDEKTVTVRTYGGTVLANTNGDGIRFGSGSGSSGRLAIGQTTNSGTSTSTAPVGGELDLNVSGKKVQVTLDYKSITDGNWVLRLYVNNNGTNSNASVHDTQSQVYNFVSETAFLAVCEAGSTAAGGTVKLVIDPTTITTGASSLSNAFIGLQATNGGITITSIKIEYIDN